MSFILGKKLKMTQVWREEEMKGTKKGGEVNVKKFLKMTSVTPILVQPNKVSLVRTKERDGYEAVQISFGGKTKEFRNRPSNPIDISKFKKGDTVTADAFKPGDKVIVSGIMKGRGFAGVVKRHNFGGGPKTHGQKNRHRAPGSIGSTAFQRVVPGRRMAGHMGVTRVTRKNLMVIEVDAKKNVIMLRGAVPGTRGGILEIRK
jgi:large subunit ribosomal protein L3